MGYKTIFVKALDVKPGDIMRCEKGSAYNSKVAINHYEVLENQGLKNLVRKLKVINGKPTKTKCKPVFHMNHDGNVIRFFA